MNPYEIVPITTIGTEPQQPTLVQSKIVKLQQRMAEKQAKLHVPAGTNERLTDMSGKPSSHNSRAFQGQVHNYGIQQPERLGELFNEAQVYTREDGSKYYDVYDWAGTENDDPSNPTDNIETTWKQVEVPTNKFGSPDTRNAYLKLKDGIAKFGLARSNLSEEAIKRGITPAKARYMDQTKLDFPLYDNKYKAYDGTPGPKGQGTTTAFDIEFLNKPITKFEYDRYRDIATINARAIGTGPVSKQDSLDYGGGKTEYTNQAMDPLFGDKLNRNKLEPGTPLPTVPYGFNADGTPSSNQATDGYQYDANGNFIQGQPVKDSDNSDTDGHFGEFIDSAQSSIAQYGANAVNTLKEAVGADNIAAYDKWASDIEKKLGGDGKVGWFIGEEGKIIDSDKSIYDYREQEVTDKEFGVSKGSRDRQRVLQAEAKKAMKNADKSFEAGDYLGYAGNKAKEIYANIKNTPMALGDSAAEMLSVANPATLMLTVANRNVKHAEDYEKAHPDKKLSKEDRALLAFLDTISLYGEKLVLGLGGNKVKDIITGSSKVKGAAAGILGVLGGEYTQERFDTAIEQFAPNMDKPNKVAAFKDAWESDEARLAGTAGMTAAGTLAGGGAGAAKVVSLGVDGIKGRKKPIDDAEDVKTSKGTDTTPKEEEGVEDIIEASDDEVTQARTVFRKVRDKIKHKQIIGDNDVDDIIYAEEVVNRYKEGPDKVKAVAAVKDLKLAMVENLSETDLDKTPIVFGANKDSADGFDKDARAIKAGHYIATILEATDYNPDASLEEQLIKVAEANGITKEQYTGTKNALAVEVEATDSSSGYNTYGTVLHRMLNLPTTDKTGATKVVNKLTGFKSSQVKFAKIVQAELDRVSKIVNTYNTNNLAEEPIEQYVVKIPQKSGDSTWKLNVGKDESGKYYVEKATQGIIDLKLKNVKDMEAILARNAKNIKDKLDIDLTTKGISTGIYINPTLDATAGKTTKSRLAANTYYAKIGANKVITTEDSKWKQPAFSEENEDNINPGKYSKEDVVVVSIPNSLNNKTFKEMLSKKSSEISKQVNAATKAGATIVFDTDLHGDHFKELAIQLAKYKGYSNDKASGGNVFKPKDDVAASNIKVDEDKVEATKTANTRREAIIKAVDDLHNGKEYTNDTINKIIKDSYKGNTANFEKTLASSFDKAVKQAVKALNTVAELEDVAGTVKTDALLKAEKVIKGFSDTIMKEAKKEVTDSEVSIGEYSDMLTKYKEAITEGKTEEAEAVLNGLEDNDIVNYVLDNSQSKGLPSVYRYTYVDTKGKQSTRVALTKESLAKNKQEDSIVTIQEIDINKIVVKGSPTFLNSVAAGMMGKTVSKYTNAFIGLLKQALASETVKGKTESTLHSLGLATDPARALMYSIDPATGEEVINENVALALQLATDEFIAFNSRMLSTGYKSDADIASMLGIDEGKVTAKLRKAIAGKGMFKKTLANSIGKAAMAKLGLSRATDIEEETFDKLAADLGNMGVMAMLKSGDVSADTTMTSSELGHLMGVKSNSKKPVTFIHFTSEDVEVVDAYIASRRTLFEDVHENVQEELAFRREPSTRPIEHSKYANEVAKTKAGFTTSDDVESAMEDLRAVEWNVDFEVLDRVMEDKKSLESWLGYTDDTSGMSFYDAEGQVSKNRDILKSIDELKLIKESGNQKLFFDWFYSSNGRYMMEANTLNPQTDKLHRFIIQPSSHISKLTVTKGNGVTKNGKDVTDEFDYAIVQAFGFAVDKKNSTKITAIGKALRTDKKLLTKVTKAIKNNEEFEIGDVEMEPEHIAHAYQAIVALEKLHKGGTFTTSIAAETDAVTSGFALKLMQMPILGDMFEDMFKWLNKVGVFRAGDLRGSSMNDVLDGKEFTDSYQTLAKNVKVKAKTVAENIDPKSRVRYVEDTWEKLSKVLPQFDEAMEEVSSELRALFKDPFMTFNYSAGMKSIRESLTGVLTNKVVTKMINASKGDSAYELLSVLAKDMSMSPSALQAEMTTSPLYLIKGDSGVSIDDVLSEYINAGYGTTVEDIMTSEFSEFVDAQKQINNAFRAMFAMFNKEYKESIAEIVKAKGFITATDKLEVIGKLRDKFPAIKGPMSTKEDKSDYIGIYRTKSASPGSDGTRLPAAQTSLKEGGDTKTNTIAHEIKVFEEAISSGSVVPIHYIDGALMGNLLKKTGAVFTPIHDAIMMPLGEINNGAREYNKLYHDISTEYSFIQEIVNQLGTMPDLSDKYYDQKKGKESLRTFIKSSYKGMEELNTKVQAGRKAIKAELDKGSAYMHMAALKDGVHYHNMVAPKESVKEETTTIPETIDRDEMVSKLLDVYKNLPAGLQKNIRDNVGKSGTSFASTLKERLKDC